MDIEETPASIAARAEQRVWRIDFTAAQMRVLGIGMCYLAAHHADSAPLEVEEVTKLVDGMASMGLFTEADVECVVDKLKVFTEEDRRRLHGG